MTEERKVDKVTTSKSIENPEEGLQRMLENIAMTKGERTDSEEGYWKKQTKFRYANSVSDVTVVYEINSYYTQQGELDAMGERLTVEVGAEVVFERAGGRITRNNDGDWKKVIEELSR